MTKTVLTQDQINFLTAFGSSPAISEKFCLSGGTALAGFYIPYIAKDRLKFDAHIDLLKLGSQFNKATQATDLPNMIEPLAENIWHSFFLAEADKLKPQIIE
jgi:hypothetical protein